jgi:peptide/nickel transport system permease protein
LDARQALTRSTATSGAPAADSPEVDVLLVEQHRAWRSFRRHRLALVGMVFLLILTISAIAAPVVAGRDPFAVDLRARGKPPSAEHLLGTELAGRDVWARLVYGGRVSLSVGLVSVTLAGLIGISLGLISGYNRGAVDQVLMRCTDVIMTLPTLVIILAVVSFLGPSIYNAMAVIGLLGWPGLARLVRGQVLSLRELGFVEAARALGAGDASIVSRHILPNVVGPIVVWGSFGVAGAILTEAALSFLGFGVQPPTASWGNMLNAALSLDVIETKPWIWVPPGVAVTVTVLAINFVGDALRDALDPHQIGR